LCPDTKQSFSAACEGDTRQIEHQKLVIEKYRRMIFAARELCLPALLHCDRSIGEGECAGGDGCGWRNIPFRTRREYQDG
jgi:hypothetical protein